MYVCIIEFKNKAKFISKLKVKFLDYITYVIANLFGDNEYKQSVKSREMYITVMYKHKLLLVRLQIIKTTNN